MPRESLANKRSRVEGLIKALQATYPEAHCELHFENPLQLLIATILSAQCTDVQVNRVTESLFKRYKTAQDFAEAPLTELESAIRRIGLFRNKAKNIKACCQALIEDHGSQVPCSMDELIRLAGVGRKTANVVLGNAFNINHGVVVDTHVARLAARFKMSLAKTPEKIEQDLMKLVDREDWTLFSHWMIWHGRRRCAARNPDCENCEIKPLCPSAP